MAADESGHIGTISRQALGRTASLGDIYDATTDTFSHMSIFRKQLPADCEAVNKTDTPDSRISYVSARCLKEMFNELNVTGELKLSVLAGMCELDGSAKYLSEKKSTCKAVENTLLYNIKTVTERLELSNHRIKKYISKKVLRKPVGTHVVIEIEWGASCGVTVTDQYREETKRQEVEGIIRMIFRKLMAFIPTPGNVGGENAQEEATNWQRFSIEVFGDVVPDCSEEFPQTFDGAQAMIRKVPELIQRYNVGKGKPLTYIMVPLSRLGRKIPTKRLITFRSVGENWIIKCVRLFDNITELREKVQDQIEELKNHRDATASDLEEASRFANGIEDHAASIKCEFAKLLEKVRSAKENVECLDTFCDKNSQTPDDKCREWNEVYQRIQARIAEH